MVTSKTWNESETGNWNTAKFYSLEVVAGYLAEIKEYFKIANFGAADFLQEMMLESSLKNQARVNATKRLIVTNIDLINATKFALKSQKDKDRVDLIKDLFYKVKLKHENTYEYIEKMNVNGSKQKEIYIIEDKYNQLLEYIKKLHAELLYPLNRADLVFRGSEEYNPFERKQQAIEELLESG